MQMMHEGDKWELYIPSELAYGDRPRGQYIKVRAFLSRSASQRAVSLAFQLTSDYTVGREKGGGGEGMRGEGRGREGQRERALLCDVPIAPLTPLSRPLIVSQAGDVLIFTLELIKVKSGGISRHG
eukprot:4725569-Pleurochrysis_carterae.AAC.1